MIIAEDCRYTTDRCLLRIISKDDIPSAFSASQVEGFTDGMTWSPPESPDEMIATH